MKTPKTDRLRRLFMTITTLAFSLAYVGNVAAQTNQICAVGTQTITYKCYGGCGNKGCSCMSSTTVTVPQGGVGSGQVYTSTATQCCGSPITYMTESGGSCVVQPGQITRKFTADLQRNVFIRGCDGRFRLYKIGA